MKDYELEMLLDEDLRDPDPHYALTVHEGSQNIATRVVKTRSFWAIFGLLCGVAGTLLAQKLKGSASFGTAPQRIQFIAQLVANKPPTVEVYSYLLQNGIQVNEYIDYQKATGQS